MKKFILIASASIIVFGIVNKSLAGVVEQGCDCGENCCYTIDDKGKMILSVADGKSQAKISENFEDKGITELIIPYGFTHINANFIGNKIKALEFPDSVVSIGGDSFINNKIETLIIPNSVVSIGYNAFENNNLETVEIPDSVKYVEEVAFSGNPLTEVIVPDSIEFEMGAFGGYSLQALEDLKIKCRGEEKKCKELFRNYEYSWDDDPVNLEDIVSVVTEKECFDMASYYYNGAKCVSRSTDGKIHCLSNYKANDGYCDRIRYTPPEAAKVLKDDNTNEVTITFRK